MFDRSGELGGDRGLNSGADLGCHDGASRPWSRTHGAGSGARTRDLRMSQTSQGLSCVQCLMGCPMSPTPCHQLRHPGGDQTTHGPVFKDAAHSVGHARSPLPAPWTLSAERLGGNLGIQSFDPRKHVRKERTPSRCGS